MKTIKKVGILTAGGLAPCLSTAVAAVAAVVTYVVLGVAFVRMA